jgi:hypothetical protein
MKLVSFLSKGQKEARTSTKVKSSSEMQNRVISKASTASTIASPSKSTSTFETFVPFMLPPDLFRSSQSNENSNPNIGGDFSLFENQIDVSSIKSSNPFRRKPKVQAPQSQGPTRFESPSIRYINGKRVTIIDYKLKVFLVDLINEETCDLVRTVSAKKSKLYG